MKSLVENKIILNNKEYIYVITQKNIKNIYFRVKDDLKIHVSVSFLVSQKKIENMLKENEKELEKMYLKIANKQTDEIRYLGNSLTFISALTKPYIENNFIYAKSQADAKEYIYKRAYEVFLSRLTQIRHNFKSLPEFTLKVRKMSTRWGVCNKKSMSVTLNTELIKKDVNLIDYVIIHELCHFKYMNHSDQYWKYVESFYPYYKQARKELKY